jgi:hypothetical protein
METPKYCIGRNTTVIACIASTKKLEESFHVDCLQ